MLRGKKLKQKCTGGNFRAAVPEAVPTCAHSLFNPKIKVWFFFVCFYCKNQPSPKLNHLSQVVTKRLAYFSAPEQLPLYSLCILCVPCAPSELYISGFTTNSTSPPLPAVPPLYFLHVTWGALMEQTQTLPWVSYSVSQASASSHLSENHCPKTGSNCTQTLWWPLPMLLQIYCVWPTH